MKGQSRMADSRPPDPAALSAPVERRRLRAASALLAAALVACAACALVTRARGREDDVATLLEADGDSAYGRALVQIRTGRDIASEGHFRRAATHFLRAKDLWQVSGVPGWESAQSLADAAIDQDPSALHDRLWAVSKLVSGDAGAGTGRPAAGPMREGVWTTAGSPAMPGTALARHGELQTAHAPWDVIPHRQQQMWEPAYPQAGTRGYAGFDNDDGDDVPTFDVRNSDRPVMTRHFSPDDEPGWSVEWDRSKDPVMAGKMDDARWMAVQHMKQ